MKDETQSLHLAQLMQEQKHYPSYELVLPSSLVKKSSIKKFSEGDVLLVGYSSLSLRLLKNDNSFANVEIEESNNSRKIKIVNIEENNSIPTQNKKYETLKYSFSFLQSRVFEVNHKIDISSIDLEKLNLVVNNKVVAQGTLVNVDDEIAIKITKVDL
jgi:hypothetical protein